MNDYEAEGQAGLEEIASRKKEIQYTICRAIKYLFGFTNCQKARDAASWFVNSRINKDKLIEYFKASIDSQKERKKYLKKLSKADLVETVIAFNNEEKRKFISHFRENFALSSQDVENYLDCTQNERKGGQSLIN